MSADWKFERKDDFQLIKRIDVDDVITAGSDLWIPRPGGNFTPLFQDFSEEMMIKKRVTFARIMGLSRLQTEMLVLTAEGMTQTAIGARLNKHPETIKDHLDDVADIIGGRKINVLCAAAGLWGIVSPTRLCVAAR